MVGKILHVCGGGQCVCSVSQSCLTLCDLMNHRPPGSSVHGISQAKILKWVVISFSRGSSWPRDQTHVFCIGFIIAKLLGKPPTAMTLKSFRMREGLGLKNTTRATRKCLNKWSREMRTCWMTRWRKEEHKIFKRPETDYNIIISLLLFFNIEPNV